MYFPGCTIDPVDYRDEQHLHELDKAGQSGKDCIDQSRLLQ
jgi:hypothetical protein